MTAGYLSRTCQQPDEDCPNSGLTLALVEYDGGLKATSQSTCVAAYHILRYSRAASAPAAIISRVTGLNAVCVLCVHKYLRRSLEACKFRPQREIGIFPE